MTGKAKRRLIWAGAALLTLAVVLLIAGVLVGRNFEPFVRDQTVAYLEKKFDCDVKLESLHARVTGRKARVTGRNISLRMRGNAGGPPFMAMREFSFHLDLGEAVEGRVRLPSVKLEGLELNIPPKGQWPKVPVGTEGKNAPDVVIAAVQADGTKLRMLPKEETKQPLEFEIRKLRLEEAGPGVAMRYDAELTNAKPPGLIRCKGTFGPWASGAAETPLAGKYRFENADLGVFKGIAGTLASTGEFQGVLQEIIVDGEARVPDFRLTGAGNRVNLETQFHAIVDGTNGNTKLEPVEAKLGETRFTVRGAVERNEGETGKTTDLLAVMPGGRLEDVLRLAMKDEKPFLKGKIVLNARVIVPPGKMPVADKLKLDGQFILPEARFTSVAIQQKLDDLSRRAQGSPTDESIAEVPARMEGQFQMSGGVIWFSGLRFQMPGAKVQLGGNYNLRTEALDFRGKVSINARLSEMMKTEWKRWALKPLDPFLAKEGYGTVSDFTITGTSKEPKFGR